MDVPAVFSGSTMTFEDDRFDYGEQRFVTLGFLREVAVSVVHTETESEIREKAGFFMKVSKTNWKRVRGMKDSQIRITKEHPEADVRHIVRTIIRHGLKPVQPQKTSISLRVDDGVGTDAQLLQSRELIRAITSSLSI
jgi:hypothetical protein